MYNFGQIFIVLHWCFFIVAVSFGLVCEYLLLWMSGRFSVLYWDVLRWIIEVNFEVVECGHITFSRIWLRIYTYIYIYIYWDYGYDMVIGNGSDNLHALLFWPPVGCSLVTTVTFDNMSIDAPYKWNYTWVLHTKYRVVQPARVNIDPDIKTKEHTIRKHNKTCTINEILQYFASNYITYFHISLSKKCHVSNNT